MNGSSNTSPGVLYFNIPGWPIGFGDDEKAEKLLKKALVINADGINSNYFYRNYLLNEKRYKEAKIYLFKVKNASSRPLRPLTDAGRQKRDKRAFSFAGA